MDSYIATSWWFAFPGPAEVLVRQEAAARGRSTSGEGEKPIKVVPNETSWTLSHLAANFCRLLPTKFGRQIKSSGGLIRRHVYRLLGEADSENPYVPAAAARSPGDRQRGKGGKGMAAGTRVWGSLSLSLYIYIYIEREREKYIWPPGCSVSVPPLSTRAWCRLLSYTSCTKNNFINIISYTYTQHA